MEHGSFQKPGALKQTPNSRALLTRTPAKRTPNLWKQQNGGRLGPRKPDCASASVSLIPATSKENLTVARSQMRWLCCSTDSNNLITVALSGEWGSASRNYPHVIWPSKRSSSCTSPSRFSELATLNKSLYQPSQPSAPLRRPRTSLEYTSDAASCFYPAALACRLLGTCWHPAILLALRFPSERPSIEGIWAVCQTMASAPILSNHRVDRFCTKDPKTALRLTKTSKLKTYARAAS